MGAAAVKENIEVIKATATMVGSTLGPQGGDVLVINNIGDSIITNDGATILKNANISHPLVKNLVGSAITQEKKVGDGTSTLAALSGELLSNGQDLIEKDNMRGVIIAKGYQLALNKAKELLEQNSIEVDLNDNIQLKAFVNTCLTGKNTEGFNNIYDICIEAIKLTNGDTNKIIPLKISSGDINESKLYKGIVLDVNVSHPNMPREFKAPKVLLLDQEIGNVNPAVDLKYEVTNIEMLNKVRSIDEDRAREYFDKIKKLDINVVICSRDINDYASDLFAQNNILAVRNVDNENLRMLSKSLNCRIVKNIKDAKNSDLGVSDTVKLEKLTDNEEFVKIECNNSNIVTILICGSNASVIEEYARGIDDALGVLKTIFKHNKFVYGAGVIEMQVSQQLREYAQTITNGKLRVAVEKYADSLEVVPKLLAISSGLDPLDALGRMKLNKNYGVNVEDSDITPMNHVIEPVNVKIQALIGATEVACSTLRIGYNIQGKVE